MLEHYQDIQACYRRVKTGVRSILEPLGGRLIKKPGTLLAESESTSDSNSLEHLLAKHPNIIVQRDVVGWLWVTQEFSPDRRQLLTIHPLIRDNHQPSLRIRVQDKNNQQDDLPEPHTFITLEIADNQVMVDVETTKSGINPQSILDIIDTARQGHQILKALLKIPEGSDRFRYGARVSDGLRTKESIFADLISAGIDPNVADILVDPLHFLNLPNLLSPTIKYSKDIN